MAKNTAFCSSIHGIPWEFLWNSYEKKKMKFWDSRDQIAVKRFFTSGNSCFVGLPKLISPCYKNEIWKPVPHTKSKMGHSALKQKAE
jgi:hypothetical protein